MSRSTSAADAVHTESFRVLTVEDHPMVSEWLAARLRECNIVHVGNLESPDDLTRAVRERDVDLVIIDIALPGADPFSAVEESLRENKLLRVAFLSAIVTRSNIERALSVGAAGYFSKLDNPDEIVAGLRSIARGRLAFGSEVRRAWPVLSTIEGKPYRSIESKDLASGTETSELTSREREVLRYFGLGLSRQEIAKALHRSPKTIDKHRTSLMAKLGIHDRVHLALFAIREGLVDPKQQSRPGEDRS